MVGYEGSLTCVTKYNITHEISAHRGVDATFAAVQKPTDTDDYVGHSRLQPCNTLRE